MVYLAVVGCAAVFGACKLDPSSFERHVEAGVGSKEEQESGGADLVPEARPKSPAAGAHAPAADGGTSEPQPPAADVRDASPDPEPADAAPTPTAPAADGGSADPEPEDDAGSVDPEPAPATGPTPCTTHDCYCTTYCQRGAALACPEDPPVAACIALCQQPIKSGCEAQELAAMRCKAELPADQYICDEDLLAFIVLGCQAEDLAARNCRTR